MCLIATWLVCEGRRLSPVAGENQTTSSVIPRSFCNIYWPADLRPYVNEMRDVGPLPMANLTVTAKSAATPKSIPRPSIPAAALV